jgi:hypothetical protein
VLQELARVYVVDALKRWEPRVVVTSVKLTRERQDGENVLAIRLRYNVISANVPGNNVLIEGVEQTIRAYSSHTRSSQSTGTPAGLPSSTRP